MSKRIGPGEGRDPFFSMSRQVNLGQQRRVEIDPMRILRFDQVDLPIALPALDLPLADEGSLERFMHLEPDEPINAIFCREAGKGFGLVFPNPAREIVRRAYV